MSVTISPQIHLQFFTASGVVASGYQLFTYQAGTSIKQATWTDSTQSTQNANPLQLDSQGRAYLWPDPTLVYKYVLALPTDTDPPQSPVETVDNVQSPINLSNITQALIGTTLYPRTSAEIAAGVTPTNYAYTAGTVDRYGTNTTPGTTDMTAAINAAVSVAAQTGGVVQFLAAIYAHASTLVWKNGVIYRGMGIAQTILKYTGTSDQIQVNNPINSSTIANYDVRDMWLQSVSATAGKANFADVGSTFVYFQRVRFSGAMINLILDQTEIAQIEDCILQDIVANASAAGVWLVNGAEHTGGANGGYTNQIGFRGCQFNSVGQSTTPVLVADDGGLSHSFVSCNFNAGSSQIRITGCGGLVVQGCEMEGCGVAAVDAHTTKWGGNSGFQSTSVTIASNTLSTGALPVLNLADASAIWNAKVSFNGITCSGHPYSGLANIAVEFIAEGNGQTGTGDGNYLINNVFSSGTGYTVAWTGSGSNPALGNGNLVGEYSRKGKEVTVRINLGIGSTTTLGSGNWSFSVPYLSANEGFNYLAGAVWAVTAGAAPNAGIAFVAPNTQVAFLRSTNNASGATWGAAVPGAWASSDSLQLQITYKAANWVG